MAGIAYRHNMLWVQSLLFVPSFIGTVTHSTLGKLLHTAPPSGAQEPMGATLEIQREQHIERIEQQMAWAQVQRQNQVYLNAFRKILTLPPTNSTFVMVFSLQK